MTLFPFGKSYLQAHCSQIIYTIGIFLNEMYRIATPQLYVMVKRPPNEMDSVADPGFPVGGALAPEAVMFRKFCMSKQKNLNP